MVMSDAPVFAKQNSQAKKEPLRKASVVTPNNIATKLVQSQQQAGGQGRSQAQDMDTPEANEVGSLVVLQYICLKKPFNAV